MEVKNKVSKDRLMMITQWIMRYLVNNNSLRYITYPRKILKIKEKKVISWILKKCNIFWYYEIVLWFKKSIWMILYDEISFLWFLIYLYILLLFIF